MQPPSHICNSSFKQAWHSFWANKVALGTWFTICLGCDLEYNNEGDDIGAGWSAWVLVFNIVTTNKAEATPAKNRNSLTLRGLVDMAESSWVRYVIRFYTSVLSSTTSGSPSKRDLKRVRKLAITTWPAPGSVDTRLS
jgi:hypothetical protein